ncbi:hypothetical protein BHAOGJBA_1694 [Methylobacterium hispanicum]|uniref:Baseplate protein J-like domain-containing protein n=1 Tax=Methylobacterium hispanicum TaxID=270350 RepID=A0AAV4ZK12_9HYPH|nr:MULTISPECIES: baseplate J/gp47 family protein [Methylobacterium]GJD88181.1 hypothetical protein BHAOGJBA_1694 [Methylobacterium hispanicum]
MALTPTPVTARFAAPALLKLGPPPALAAQAFDTLLDTSKARLLAEMAAAGIAYDVANVDSDPAVRVTRVAVHRTVLRRQMIDEAVAQTFLGSATGPMLDQRAADYMTVRRSIASEDPTLVLEPNVRPDDVPPLWTWQPYMEAAGILAAWYEDDESLRSSALLAWEALSVAGPKGAYAYHAGQAHPNVLVRGVGVYGPEDGFVPAGEVYVVVQSNLPGGVPSAGVLDAVARRLDAFFVIDETGAVRVRTARDAQSVRPLGAKVSVMANQPLTYGVAATLYIPAGADADALLAQARANLAAYEVSQQYSGVARTLSGLETALSCANADGLPTIPNVVVSQPPTDLAVAYNQIAILGDVSLTVEIV